MRTRMSRPSSISNAAGPAPVLSSGPGVTITSANPAAMLRRCVRPSGRSAGTTSLRRATSQTDAPGAKASATIDRFCSALQRRRRSGPDSTSTPLIAPSVSCTSANHSVCTGAYRRRNHPRCARQPLTGGNEPQAESSGSARLSKIPSAPSAASAKVGPNRAQNKGIEGLQVQFATKEVNCSHPALQVPRTAADDADGADAKASTALGGMKWYGAAPRSDC